MQMQCRGAVELQSMGSRGVGERGPIDLAVLQENGARALCGERITVPRKSDVVNERQAGVGTRQLSPAEAGRVVSVVVRVPFDSTVVS